MRYAGWCLIAGALFIAADTGGAAQKPLWVERAEEWLAAADHHVPGAEDDATDVVLAWPDAELETMVPYLKALAELLGHPNDRKIRRGTRPFTRGEIQRMADLARGWAARTDHIRLIKKAALLHGDIAMMSLPGKTVPDTPAPLKPSRPSTPQPGTIIIINDGRLVRIETKGLHWDLARSILDAVTPDPAADPTVRLWYRASAAHMALKREHAYSADHLERARTVLAGDAEILFFSGCLQEVLASPEVQNVVQEVRRAGNLSGIASPGLLYERAERFFRESIAIEPNRNEARLRLGHVLGLRDRHDEAARELTKALDGMTNRLLLYYGHLFLAREQQALGQVQDARQSYERAAALYPRAQAPGMGLSQLARRSGDRDSALKMMEGVFVRPVDDVVRDDDPWWTYYESAGRVADTWLDELRRPFMDRQ